MCKEYVEDLAQIPASHLKGVRLVVIGCAPHEFITGFRRDTGYAQELYCDPERKVYKALGLPARLSSVSGHSEHVKSGMLMGTLRSAGRFLKSMRMQGDVTQQGGAFVLGPGEVIHFAHQDASPLDHAAINDILRASGLDPLSFNKKKVKKERTGAASESQGPQGNGASGNEESKGVMV